MVKFMYKKVKEVIPMTPNEYVTSVVNKYRGVPLPTFSTLLSISTPLVIKDEIAPIIKSWAGVYLREVILSGSSAKGTAIKGVTDVDLFISLDTSTPETLKEIYEKLYDFAYKMGWQPRKQNVSIGITYKGYKVDLVPGKVQFGYYNYHSLYKYKSDSWTQTNIKEHIDIVKESGRNTEIMALKIWRKCHGLDFPSIYLELTVLEALKYKSKSAPADNVIAALNYLSSEFINNRVIDPSNTNNIISNDLSNAEKAVIARKAKESMGKPNWGQILW